MGCQNIPAVSPYERLFGYSRAVRAGDHASVAGCAAIGPDDETVAIGGPAVIGARVGRPEARD